MFLRANLYGSRYVSYIWLSFQKDKIQIARFTIFFLIQVIFGLALSKAYVFYRGAIILKIVLDQ